MCTGIDELAGAVGKVLEVAPDLYDDALKSSAQETGKTLSRVPRLINAVLAPLDIWILNKEYNIEETKKLLAKKLENVDPNKIVPPEPYVAVPAFQAISYSMNSEDLREMYSNLLAKSMNSDAKTLVHPSFVEIIKQLSPFDARFLKLLLPKSDLPIVAILRSEDEQGLKTIDYFKHIIEPEFGINIANANDFSVSIDNLIRLNIVSVDYEKFFTNEAIYSPILHSELCLQAKRHINSLPTLNHCIFKNGFLQISDLGKLFIKVCII